jgi:hypothetical protein
MHPKAPSIGIADAQPLVRERSLTAVLSRPKNKRRTEHRSKASATRTLPKSKVIGYDRIGEDPPIYIWCHEVPFATGEGSKKGLLPL